MKLISLKYIKEAIRLYPIRLQNGQTYSDWQYAKYRAEYEVERSRKEAKPLPDYLNQYRKAS